jgi:hypothetical protein
MKALKRKYKREPSFSARAKATEGVKSVEVQH